MRFTGTIRYGRSGSWKACRPGRGGQGRWIECEGVEGEGNPLQVGGRRTASSPWGVNPGEAALIGLYPVGVSARRVWQALRSSRMSPQTLSGRSGRVWADYRPDVRAARHPSWPSGGHGWRAARASVEALPRAWGGRRVGIRSSPAAGADLQAYAWGQSMSRVRPDDRGTALPSALRISQVAQEPGHHHTP